MFYSPIAMKTLIKDFLACFVWKPSGYQQYGKSLFQHEIFNFFIFGRHFDCPRSGSRICIPKSIQIQGSHLNMYPHGSRSETLVSRSQLQRQQKERGLLSLSLFHAWFYTGVQRVCIRQRAGRRVYVVYFSHKPPTRVRATTKSIPGTRLHNMYSLYKPAVRGLQTWAKYG